MQRTLPVALFEQMQEIVSEISWLKKNRFDAGLTQLLKEAADSPEMTQLVRDLLRRFTYVDLDETEKLCGEMRDVAVKIWGATPGQWIVAGIADGPKSDGSMILVRNLELAFGRGWNSAIYACIDPVFDFIKKKIVLIDDFIGSGSKLEKKINNVLQNANKKKLDVDLYVLAFAGMEVGVRHVKGILGKDKVFCAKIVRRGISDVYTGEDLSAAIGSMLELERKIVPPAPFPKRKKYSSYNFGYEQSESLYFWEHNPNMSNNVFPIFWWGAPWTMENYLPVGSPHGGVNEGSKNRSTLFKRI